MEFGDFFRDADHARRAKRDYEFLDRLVDAVAAFVEGERVVKIAVLFEKRDSRRAFRYRKARFSMTSISSLILAMFLSKYP